MTRKEIRETAEKVLKRGTSLSDVLNDGINLALRTFCNKHDFRGMLVDSTLTTTDDVGFVTLRSGYHHLLEARLYNDTLSHSLLIKSMTWCRKRWPLTSVLTKGPPMIGAVGNLHLYLYPVPDDTYTVQTTIFVIPSLDTDDEINPVPELDSALVYATTAFGFDLLERHQTANVWSARAWAEVQDAIRTEGRKGIELQHDRVSAFPEGETFISPYLDPFNKGGF